MMKKVFVCVSLQKNAERTVDFARKCSSYIREKGMIPMASQYLFHDETRNLREINDANVSHEYMVDIRICRELMMLSDEVWIFMDKDPDDLMIMILSMADELEMHVRVFMKGELCELCMA